MTPETDTVDRALSIVAQFARAETALIAARDAGASTAEECLSYEQARCAAVDTMRRLVGEHVQRLQVDPNLTAPRVEEGRQLVVVAALLDREIDPARRYLRRVAELNVGIPAAAAARIVAEMTDAEVVLGALNVIAREWEGRSAPAQSFTTRTTTEVS